MNDRDYIGNMDERELRAELERARAEVSGDVDRLAQKLSKEGMKESAKKMATEVKHSAKMEARRAIRKTGATVESNALPLALIAGGVGLLIANRYRNGSQRHDGDGYGYRARFGEAEDYYAYGDVAGDFPERHDHQHRARDGADRAREGVNRAREGASHAMDDARHRLQDGKEKLTHMASRTREQGRERFGHAMDSTRSFYSENPIAVGVMALAFGAGIGILLPSTRREQQLLGEQARHARDEVRRRAQHAGEAGLKAGKSAISEAKTEMKKAVREENGTSGPFPESRI